MSDDPRTHPASFRVTFWPRPAARNAPVDRDVLCENCGYNLRGLPGGQDICPECGTKFDPKVLRTKAADTQRSQLPWKQRRAVGFFEGYYGSIRMVLLTPKRFELEIWQGGKLSKKEANAFRWITVAHAYLPLLAIAVVLIGPKIKQPAQFLPLAAIGAAAMLMWLKKSTELLVNFFQRQTMSADVQNRVIGLAYLSSAALALSPIHLAMLAICSMVRQIERTPQPGMLFTTVALIWAVFAILQLVWWWASSLRLVRSTMRCNDAEMMMIALVFVGWWALHTALYLGLVPLAGYWLVNEVFHI